MVIKLNSELYSIISFQHIKPGKGGAFIRTKLKNLRLNTVIDKTFREIDAVEGVFLEQKNLQYLYQSGETFHFMDNKDFDQITIDKSRLKEAMPYLKENGTVTAYLCKGDIVSLDLPVFVKLKVAHTEPGIRGNTAKGGTKLAELETGLSLQVHVEKGLIPV